MTSQGSDYISQEDRPIAWGVCILRMRSIWSTESLPSMADICMIACVVRQIYSTQGSIGQVPTHTGHRCNRDPRLPATWACLHIEIPTF